MRLYIVWKKETIFGVYRHSTKALIECNRINKEEFGDNRCRFSPFDISRTKLPEGKEDKSPMDNWQLHELRERDEDICECTKIICKDKQVIQLHFVYFFELMVADYTSNGEYLNVNINLEDIISEASRYFDDEFNRDEEYTKRACKKYKHQFLHDLKTSGKAIVQGTDLEGHFEVWSVDIDFSER